MSHHHSFHLSYEVSKYKKSIEFYTTILGGELIADHTSWCNINFYGHQLTLHHNPEAALEQVENFHWGINTDRNAFLKILNSVRKTQIDMIKEPDLNGDFMKMTFRDPNGILIEFKTITEKL